MVKRILYFIKDGIWAKKDYEYENKKVRWAVRQAKVILVTARGMNKHSVIVRSAALTFYTLMSLVPIAALIFGIVKGFGLETSFNEYLYESLPQYSVIIDQVIDFANNLLMRTKGGIIASVGFVVLAWAVMRVFGNIENAFNHIWEVRRSRNVTRKFSDYMTVIFIAPILFTISNSLAVLIKNNLSAYTGAIFVDILFGIGSMVTMWILFAFIYYIMPNTKVKLRSAVMAGIIAGTAFQAFQIGYVYLQTQMTSYNVIYGSFAALPLFLIWLQTSWQILFIGAELSFAYQNVVKYEQEREAFNVSYDNRRKIMLACMLIIVRHFTNSERGPVTSESAADELNLPVRIVRDVIFDLENAGMILAVATEESEKVSKYVPAKDIHKITVSDVIDAVECDGSGESYFVEGTELKRVSEIIDDMKNKSATSTQNILLMDIIG